MRRSNLTIVAVALAAAVCAAPAAQAKSPYPAAPGNCASPKGQAYVFCTMSADYPVLRIYGSVQTCASTVMTTPRRCDKGSPLKTDPARVQKVTVAVDCPGGPPNTYKVDVSDAQDAVSTDFDPGLGEQLTSGNICHVKFAGKVPAPALRQLVQVKYGPKLLSANA